MLIDNPPVNWLHAVGTLLLALSYLLCHGTFGKNKALVNLGILVFMLGVASITAAELK
ncbi:hypothetical protein MZD04_gp298 [Pseudomonas phage Psa21]|uniref:Uncharacterized protein n=1 Tax=Pseudomonas phage Psa21 TaxID=2530023 RepID=A0A481W620_9CAUD|nr:hypothetical protein MZD04_gp298 [Pseudomonas phage Psa21]QBJ02824.1 hypothetical protein PSA21_298 [Pseudomonas phage Psa21]